MRRWSNNPSDLPPFPASGHAFYASDGASTTEIALTMSGDHRLNAGTSRKNRLFALQRNYHGEAASAPSAIDIALFGAAYAALVRPSASVASLDARVAVQQETAGDIALLAVRS